MDLHQISSYPFFIQGALFVILIILIGLVTTYLYIVFVRLKSNRDHTLRNNYEPKFRALFIEEIIINEDKTPEYFEEIVEKFRKVNLKRRAVRRILIQDIIHFRDQFSGQVHERLRQLYLDLDLHADAKAGLRSTKAKVIIMALKELMEMRVYSSYFDSENLLNHENPYVREVSRRYIISLEKEGVARVFNTLTEPLSGMEQLELFQGITSISNLEIPDFSQWIRREQEYSLVSLCLKLTAHFQQYTSVPVIEQLLTTDNSVLRKEAVNALGKLMQVQSEDSLVSIYDDQEEEVKVEIVKAIGKIGSGTRLNFLKYIFDNESGIELKKHAAKSIMNHDVQGLFLFSNLYEKASIENRTILNHAANSHIQY